MMLNKKLMAKRSGRQQIQRD